MAVVTFSTNAFLKQTFTTNASEINNAVKGNPDGGTNWEAALQQANDLKGRSGVKKHIIFLSDGNPTYRTTSYSGCYSYSFWDGRTAHPEYTTPESCQAQRYMWGENPDGSSDARTVQEIAIHTVSTMLPPWLRLTNVAMPHSMW